MSETMTELKPCPLCGTKLAGINKVEGWRWVHPFADPGYCPLAGLSLAKCSIPAWNRRTPDAAALSAAEARGREDEREAFARAADEYRHPDTGIRIEAAAWEWLSCDEQFALATKIAANVGYVLLPEVSIQDAEDGPQPAVYLPTASVALLYQVGHLHSLPALSRRPAAGEWTPFYASPPPSAKD